MCKCVYYNTLYKRVKTDTVEMFINVEWVKNALHLYGIIKTNILLLPVPTGETHNYQHRRIYVIHEAKVAQEAIIQFCVQCNSQPDASTYWLIHVCCRWAAGSQIREFREIMVIPQRTRLSLSGLAGWAGKGHNCKMQIALSRTDSWM